MSERMQSNRQMIYPDNVGVIKMALYVSCADKLFYATYDEHATNRVSAKSVWIDENGSICAKVERRINHNKNNLDKDNANK